jgi:hypothetical protein
MGEMKRRKFLFGSCIVAAGVVGPWVSGAMAAASQQAPATVTLVHGVRGLVADVYLDGALALPAFQPERTTDPLSLPAGSHDVAVRNAGDPADATPLVAATVDLPAGSRLSAVVHLGADGNPTATLFTEDVAPLPAGAARVIVRQVAAAPPIDVRLDGAPLASGLANPQEASTQVAPGNHTLEANLTGNPDPALPPQDVPTAEGRATILYLVGSAGDNSLVWLAQPLDGLQSAPSAVFTGSDGLAAAPASFPLILVVVAALALVVSGAGFFLAGRR